MGQGTRQALGHLSCSDLGKAQNARPILVCARAESPRTWAAQTWEVHKTQGPLGQYACRAAWSLGSVERESTHIVNGGKPSVVQTL